MVEEKKGKGKKKKGGEKKQEEEKKVEEVVIEKKEEDVKTETVKVEVEEKPKDDKKDSKETAPPPPPPPPPPEIVLRVFMHCEGCARKVRKCLKGFDGVVDVTTDCKTHKVVVTGEKADPLKVLDRLQKKTHRQVDLLSPIPPPPVEETKKPEDKEPPKPEKKKEEPKVITVVLKVHMHCDACSLEIKRRIERMKEVEEAIPDLKSSQVTVKGTFEPPKLVEYVYKRTGKHATIVKEDPPPLEKKEDDKGKDGKDEKKDGKKEKKAGNAEDGKKSEEKAEETKGEQKEADAKGEDGKSGTEESGPATAEEGAKMVELKTNEFQYYPPRYAMEMHAYPPQIFSDENPNACSIM
ncbi:hypothetical protein KSS87_001988 [Heliosperma pusillum]|nr:hypothetical protein KSS87_019874 [Heliosperma pusillum]KAH9626063.1 hypothetical protein KSS87_001988 [Heliosperma pusillum]